MHSPYNGDRLELKDTTFTGEVRKFATDTVWMAISRLFVRLRGLITLPFLTKAYGSEGYGMLSQMGATTALLAHVLSLRLSASYVRFLSSKKDDDEELIKAFGSMVSTILLLNIGVFIASLFGKRAISIFIFHDSKYTLFAHLIFVWVIANILFDLSLSFLRSVGRIKTISVIQLIFAGTTAILIIILTSMNYELRSVIICLIGIEYFFVILLLIVITREKGLPKANFFHIRKYLAFSLPLIPLGLLRWAVDFSDRYFITHLLSLSETGIYTVSYTLGNITFLLSFPIAFVLFPTVSKYWEYKDYTKVKKFLSYATKLLLLFSTPLATMLYFISQPLLDIFLSSEFVAGPNLVFFIGLSSVLAGVFQINVYTIYLTNKTHLLLLVFILGASVNILCNIFLIPVIGINGAAVSTLISYLMLSVILGFWGKTILNYSLLDFKFVQKLIAANFSMALWLALHEIGDIFEIITVAGSGAIVFGLTLFLLRIFSKEELDLFRKTILHT